MGSFMGTGNQNQTVGSVLRKPSVNNYHQLSQIGFEPQTLELKGKCVSRAPLWPPIVNCVV